MTEWLISHPWAVLILYVLLIVGIGIAFHQLVYKDPEDAEFEEYEDPWATLPPKWHPDPAETHLGKDHIGQRRSV